MSALEIIYFSSLQPCVNYSNMGLNLFRKKMSPWKFYNTGTGYPTKPSTALLSAISLAQSTAVVHPDL